MGLCGWEGGRGEGDQVVWVRGGGQKKGRSTRKMGVVEIWGSVPVCLRLKQNAL